MAGENLHGKSIEAVFELWTQRISIFISVGSNDIPSLKGKQHERGPLGLVLLCWQSAEKKFSEIRW